MLLNPNLLLCECRLGEKDNILVPQSCPQPRKHRMARRQMVSKYVLPGPVAPHLCNMPHDVFSPFLEKKKNKKTWENATIGSSSSFVVEYLGGKSLEMA